MSALVTVIIPCHNGEKLVGRAIKSVLAQSYQNVELLVIENNSTDNTFAILKEFEKEYADKITVYAEKKKGACAARNLGLSKAKGEWIQFLDADDELLPLKIEKQMALVKNDNPDIVIDDYTIYHSVTQKPHVSMVAQDDPWLGLINSRLGITSANLWKRESLLKVKGWDEGLSSSQEYDLMFRMFMMNCKAIVTHQVETLVHAQPDSVSRTKSSDKLFKLYKSRYTLRYRIYKFLEENNLLSSSYKQELTAYLYYHLLLLNELDSNYFKDQVKQYDFDELGSINKLKIFVKFIGHSSKRKYGNANLFLKTIEWQYFFAKNAYLLRY